MIVLYPQDVAKGYDDLSILEVKTRAAKSGTAQMTALLAAYERAYTMLAGQVGVERHGYIKRSEHYARLVELNQRLFDAFEWLHTVGLTAPADEVKAQAIETDRINGVDRPAAKRALQEHWFGAPLTEVKLGYEDQQGSGAST